ncbi:MAG: hypothetical protein U0Y68_07325 [Blastocatellia bacterium]
MIPAIGGRNGKLAYVFPGQVFRRRLAWSPDGKWLALSGSQYCARTLSLYPVSPTTGERHQLRTRLASLVNHHSPAFSPTARCWRLCNDSVFVKAPNMLAVEIRFAAARYRGEPTRLRLNLVSGPPAEKAIDLPLTPDGKELIFSSYQVEHLRLSNSRRVPAQAASSKRFP